MGLDRLSIGLPLISIRILEGLVRISPPPLLISLWELVWLDIMVFPRPLPVLLMLRLVPCTYLRGLDKILHFSQCISKGRTLLFANENLNLP